MFKRAALGLAAAMVAAALSVSPVAAQQADQQQAIKRTIFQKSDVPGTNYETVLGMAEIAANTDFASHTHPGTESSYVVEGGITLNVKGQPTREVKAGESIFIPAETPHSGRAGPNGAKILAAWVVEKGKPLASPAGPFAAAAAQGQLGTPQEARVMLDKTIAAVQAERIKTLDLINKGEGGFLDRDLYPFCFEVTDGKIVANASNNAKQFLGTDIRALKDASGRVYGPELYDAGQKPEGKITEVSYMFPRPGPDETPVSKVSMVARAGDLACGVGSYR